MKRRKSLLWVVAAAMAATLTMNLHAYQGMATPKLHVSGRFLQDPSGKNVLLHGYMQPGASWFNGEGNNFANPTNFTSTTNVAPALNFYRDVANIMSTTGPQYGRTHGWTASYVRFIGDHTGISNFAPGWDVNGNLTNSSQFNGWITNVLVPYINHCRSRGLYVVICGNPSVAYPGGDTNKNMTQQYRNNLITFWQAVANAPGIKSVDNVMFEICNEPVTIETSFGANNWGSNSGPYFQALTNFMQPIVNAIRNTGADNVVWVPCLGWQGEPKGFAQYPITGTNVGYAAHLYPAYGNVVNSASAMQNLWNSNYKPAADLKPMLITEMFWFPNPAGGYDDLFNGTTAGFGNNAKGVIDNQGNVSYLVGMTFELFGNLNAGLANHTLHSNQGAQASFDWWPTYTWAAPGSGGGGGTIADGTYRFVARHSGRSMEVQGAATGNGSQIVQYDYFGGNHQRWTVTNRGNNQYSIIGVASGRAVDINNGSTANGAKVQLWDYSGGNMQKFTFTATSGGYYRVSPVHAPTKCLDVQWGQTGNSVIVQQWDYTGGTPQQWSLQAP
jgi:endoglucanase